MLITLLKPVYFSIKAPTTQNSIVFSNFQDNELLQPQLQVLDKKEVEASSREIRRQIEEINERLTQGEKDTILQEADVDNPEGTVYTLEQ